MDTRNLKIISVVISLLRLCRAADDESLYPKPIPKDWYPWIDEIAFDHVVNLTEYLIKDATYKLRHAEKIQEKHKHSITYELGTIAAGILDRFKQMLKIYRTFADDKNFNNMIHKTDEYLNAFHLIQGEYNEIRMEKGMFFDIVREYESTRGETTKFPLPPGITLPRGGLAGGKIRRISPDIHH